MKCCLASGVAPYAHALGCKGEPSVAEPVEIDPGIEVESLTATQRRVVELIATGHLNGEIAAELGVSQKTVDSHRRDALKRIVGYDVRVRGDVVLTRYALKRGWVTLD